ncbi:hypothetical protein C8R45DRAFT_931378 [Mycena sanguinolenta]|nr:hypothetical protein C8R45DRAFT_931378 [Mycena sanguinolenta]
MRSTAGAGMDPDARLGLLVKRTARRALEAALANRNRRHLDGQRDLLDRPRATTDHARYGSTNATARSSQAPRLMRAKCTPMRNEGWECPCPWCSSMYGSSGPWRETSSGLWGIRYRRLEPRELDNLGLLELGRVLVAVPVRRRLEAERDAQLVRERDSMQHGLDDIQMRDGGLELPIEGDGVGSGDKMVTVIVGDDDDPERICACHCKHTSV